MIEDNEDTIFPLGAVESVEEVREASAGRAQDASTAHRADVDDVVSMLQSVETISQDDYEIKCKDASSCLSLLQQAISLKNQDDNE